MKFADADGRQVKQRLGPEAEGWTRRKAERELRQRLADVERKGWRKPAALTFASYAETWFTEGEKRRRWKPTTVAQYRSVRERLVDEFGPLPLETIRPRHVAVYIAAMSDTRGTATVSRDVSALHAILRDGATGGARQLERGGGGGARSCRAARGGSCNRRR